MKKSKFIQSQIAFVLRQAEEGTPIPGQFCAPIDIGGIPTHAPQIRR
jgi:hypothetical protein